MMTYIDLNKGKTDKEEVSKEEVVAKVWLAKHNNQKMISVPKACDIEPGDFVQLTKLKLIK
jgi:hypothetical protein